LRRCSPVRCRSWIILAAASVALTVPRPAAAQTVTDVLTFLLTNRSIPTGDFVQDRQATTEARDTVANFLQLELATLPVSSSAGGFTYRLNPAVGTVQRASDSFGPFFIDRSLTSGAKQASVAISGQSAEFDAIDGRSLTDGTLISTASRFNGQTQPFDVETLTLRIRTSTISLLADYGITDTVDVGVAVPLVAVRLSGERIDTFRGQSFRQASGSSTATGLGDVLFRTKYNFLRSAANAGSGAAIGVELTLPTGDKDNLLGAGKASAKPLIIGSFDEGPVAGHVNVGYSFGGLSNEFDYGGAVTVTAATRLTLIGEILGRHLDKLGSLTEVTAPNTATVGVETIRLSSTQEGTTTVIASAGFKWNVASTWLLSVNVVRPLTSSGLTAEWIPRVAFDYSFGQ